MTSYGIGSERVTDDQVHTLAEHVGVCVRPLVRRVTDTSSGESSYVAVPCGSTRERVCKPCADKARRVRMQQCREGWHRTTEPERPEPTTDNGDDTDGADESGDDLDETDEDADTEDEDSGYDEGGSGAPRRTRSTKRREDVPDLPKVRMHDTTLGRAFTGNDGTTYRPSMFLTFTLDSYGPVFADGTPKHPGSYDYRRAALDALHFPKVVDRLFQNLRRCAGYKVQYFATVEPQKRLALHLHAAIRGTIPRATVKQVVAATYHQVWWPAHDRPVYAGGRLPVWDESAGPTDPTAGVPVGGYVDPITRQPLPTWDDALDDLDNDPGAEPAHVVRLGPQFDYQGIIAANEAEVRRSVGYLTKYLTKSVAETYDRDTISTRQKAHRDRLHAEVRYLACTPECANWLRFGIQPKNAEPGMAPGECERPAHHCENLGHGGRRVLCSRDWSGKRVPEHKADRAAAVRETLVSAGVEMHDTDRYSADAVNDDGEPRYEWEEVDITRDINPHAYRDLVNQTIRERQHWRKQYNTAKTAATPRDGPPGIRSATRPVASATA